MKSQKYTIQMIILVIFEVIVGIMLLANPEGYEMAFLLLFNIFDIVIWYALPFLYYFRFLLTIFLFVIGIRRLNRYFKGQENTSNPMYTVFAIMGMLVGLALLFFFENIFEMLQEFGVLFGIIIVILGLYKLNSYFEARDKELAISKIDILSGVLAIIFGIIITAFPNGLAVLSEDQMIGITLIVEAVLDILSIIQISRKQKRIVNYQIEESES